MILPGGKFNPATLDPSMDSQDALLACEDTARKITFPRQ
jgi:hypothetical protein